jgi:hypothetical protein
LKKGRQKLSQSQTAWVHDDEVLQCTVFCIAFSRGIVHLFRVHVNFPPELGAYRDDVVDVVKSVREGHDKRHAFETEESRVVVCGVLEKYAQAENRGVSTAGFAYLAMRVHVFWVSLALWQPDG